MPLGALWSILKQTFADFGVDEGLERAAALAFYTALGLSPTLLFFLSAAEYLGDDARNSLVKEIRATVGSESAQGIDLVLEAAKDQKDAGFLGALIGIVTLLFSAGGIFAQLQSALNHIWNVRLKAGAGAWGWLRARLLSMGLVLATLFLLLASTVVTAAVSLLFASEEVVWQGMNLAASLAIYTVLFAVIFKYLPDARISYGDVWLGAALTSILFAVGKLVIGLYIGNSAIASSYGAAGSLVALLVWVYYSSAIVLFGAELTQVVATRLGRTILPADNAESDLQEAATEADAVRKGAA